MNNNSALIEELVNAVCNGSIESKWSLIKMKAVDEGVNNIQGVRTLIEGIVDSVKGGDFDRKLDIIKLQAADADIAQDKLPQIIAAVKMKVETPVEEDPVSTAAEIAKEKKESNTENANEKLKSDVGIVSQILKNKLLITLVLILALVCPFFTGYSFFCKLIIAIGGSILYTMGIILTLYFKPLALKAYLLILSALIVGLTVFGNITVGNADADTNNVENIDSK